MVQRDYTDCMVACVVAVAQGAAAREAVAREAVAREVAAQEVVVLEEEAMVEVEEVASAEQGKSPVPAPISVDGLGL